MEFAYRINDFENLVDPHRLYNHCFGLESSELSSEKNTSRREKYVYPSFLIFPLFLFLFRIPLFGFVFAEIATRYSKDKYACVKGMKNEPLSQLVVKTKKRKLNEEKGEMTTSPIIHTVTFSPTSSLEMMTFMPPATRFEGKTKVGKKVWGDKATALGLAHNVITDKELKGLSSIPCHKLVNRHIHKLV